VIDHIDLPAVVRRLEELTGVVKLVVKPVGSEVVKLAVKIAVI
jgi:hypothetical protein